MATTYGMGGGTPIMSTTMPPPPSGMGGMATPMATPMATQNMGSINTGGFTRNMSLPLASNRPINVDENTPNLEEIQGFPVAGRTLDGTHFHQDPVTGQMYRMTDELHDRIPQILADRRRQMGGGTTVTAPTMTTPTATTPTQTIVTPPTMGGGMGTTVTTVEPSVTDVSEFISLSANRFNQISDTSLFSDLLMNTMVNDTVPFTQPVVEIQQSSFVPVRNQDFSLDTYTTNTVQSYGDSGFIPTMSEPRTLINPINNFSQLSSVSTPTEIPQQSKPVNRFTNLSGIIGNDMGLRYYTPINKFYNSISR